MIKNAFTKIFTSAIKGKVYPNRFFRDYTCFKIGGPARAIAHHFGCHVTGIDITEEFCAAGKILTEKMGLGDKVDIRLANALDMPCEDDTFDVVWMQEVKFPSGVSYAVAPESE